MTRSPLHRLHVERGATFVDFGGWEMPLRYRSILTEHHDVRSGCGWFDVSHLGRFWLTGANAIKVLEQVCSNRASGIEPGSTQYTLVLNDDGGVIDDMVIWRFEDRFLVAPNAANHERVIERFRAAGGVVEDLRPTTVAIAVQGPQAPQVLESVVGRAGPRYRTAIAEYHNEAVFMATTGYTGELGGELVLAPALAAALVTELEAAGAVPCGLGARDTLRLEAGLPLWGHEMDESITPLEAGLAFAVDFNHEFPGKQALQRQLEDGVPRRLVAFRMPDRQPPRSGQRLIAGALEGVVTSGNYSPMLERGIGFGLLPTGVGEPVEVEIRGSRRQVEICSRSFLKG